MNGAGSVNNWIVLCVALPMATGIATIVLRGRLSLQRWIGCGSLGLTALLAAWWTAQASRTGPVVSQMGEWPAPFGITIAIDALSGMLIAGASVTALGCLLFAIGTKDEADRRGWLHPLTHLLILGVNFSFITGDLFNLFVAFEIMLMASYALLVTGGSRKQYSQAYKYVMLNLIGSTLFVIGAGLVYGMMGTLNFADLARIVAASGDGGPPLPAAFPAVATLLLFVFALKAAAFPLWFWLPDTYHTCPVSIGALFAGLLTKVGVYSIARTMPMIFAAEPVRDGGPVVTLLLVGAGASMLVAALGALAIRELRRALALLMISSIGVMMLGVAVMSDDSLGAAAYYMTQSMLFVAAGFLCCGMVERIAGTDDMSLLGGMQRRAPWLGGAFFLVMMALVGLPPMAGFFGKAVILREGLAQGAGSGAFAASVLGLAAGAVTLLAAGRIWARVFWSTPVGDPAPQTDDDRRALRPAWAGLAVLMVAGVGMSLGAEPVLRASLGAGAALNAPGGYIEAVLEADLDIEGEGDAGGHAEAADAGDPVALVAAEEGAG
jgi:multicomponent Na+:H+ antiporter subunit D